MFRLDASRVRGDGGLGGFVSWTGICRCGSIENYRGLGGWECCLLPCLLADRQDVPIVEWLVTNVNFCLYAEGWLKGSVNSTYRD